MSDMFAILHFLKTITNVDLGFNLFLTLSFPILTLTLRKITEKGLTVMVNDVINQP